MVRIFIIEDDFIWQTKIEMMLAAYPQFKVVGFAENVRKAVDLIGVVNPDIIISDVFLGHDNVLKSMDHIFIKFPTIFLSSYQDEDSFKLAVNFPASSFLVKPFHDFSLVSSLLYLVKSCKVISDESGFLLFRGLKSGIVKLKFENMVKVEVEGNYSICFNSDGKKFARKVSLNAFFKLLDDRFIRVNKTTVVNVNYITRVDYFNKFVYINKEVFKIGRPYLRKLKDCNIGF